MVMAARLHVFSNLGQSVFDYQLPRGPLKLQLRLLLLLVQLHRWWPPHQHNRILHLGPQPQASL